AGPRRAAPRRADRRRRSRRPPRDPRPPPGAGGEGQGDPAELAPPVRDRAHVRPRRGAALRQGGRGGTDRGSHRLGLALQARRVRRGRRAARRVPRDGRVRRARQRPLRSDGARRRPPERARGPAALERREAPGARPRSLEPRGRLRRPGERGTEGDLAVRALAASIQEVFREAAARWTLVAYFALSSLFILVFAASVNLDIVNGALAGARLFGKPLDVGGESVSIDKLVLGFESGFSGFLYLVGT